MTNFFQALVDGFGQGSIYALLALGYVMIYKATKVISFAQPALMTVGGLFTYHFTREVGRGCKNINVEKFTSQSLTHDLQLFGLREHILKQGTHSAGNEHTCEVMGNALFSGRM